VLEFAVGTARNLPYYPAEVSLAGIELSDEMLAIGRRRARELAREADLRLGDAERVVWGLTLLLPIRMLETLLDPLAVRFAADHLTREPLGFEIERLERSKLGIVERVEARKIVAST
jgi:hypothetical protein